MNYQLLTKNNKPMIDRQTKLPIFAKPVNLRIKNALKELNEGLSKSESVWNNITREIRFKAA